VTTARPDRSVRPGPLPLRAVTLPPVFRARLSNGLPVWIVEQHRAPQVVVTAVMHCGALMDPPGKTGTATLTADLLDAGTEAHDALALSESVEFLGASLTFRGGLDGAYGTLLTLSGHMGDAVPLFAEALSQPVFPADQFERLRRQRLTMLMQQKDRPASVATTAFMRRIYPADHPYGKDPAGTESSIAALTRNDIISFYADHYGPGNTTLIVVGDVTPQGVIPLLERSLGRWPARARSAGEPPRPASVSPGVYLIDRPGAPQSEIRVGVPALPRNTPDFIPASVLNRVLGGQFSSRINMNLRERRGYTYGAHSSFVFLKRPGPFLVSGAFAVAATGEAAGEILAEVDAVHREGITAGELEFSRRGLIGAFALSFETPFQIAAALQALPLYGLPDDYYDGFLTLLESVSLEDVAGVAARVLDPAGMSVVVAGDASRVRDGLAALGRGNVTMLGADGGEVR